MSNLKQLMKRNEFYIALVVIGLSIFIGVLNSVFFSFQNLADICRSATVYGIFSIGTLMVILSGGIDVSFPAIATVSTYATLMIYAPGGFEGNIVLFMLTACAIGLVLGLVNGLFIAVFDFPSLIVTLATSSIYYGIQFVVLGSFRINKIPSYLTGLSRMSLFTFKSENGSSQLPLIFLFFIGVAIIAFVVLRYTMLGRAIHATGGNRNAAERVGFGVKKTQFFIYGAAGLLAALGGVIYTVMTRQGDPASIIGLEMTIISVVVLGGVDINGGKGSVFGVLLGLLFVLIINNSLILIGVQSHWQQLILGLAMFVNASITAFRSKLASRCVHEIDRHAEKEGETQ